MSSDPSAMLLMPVPILEKNCCRLIAAPCFGQFFIASSNSWLWFLQGCISWMTDIGALHDALYPVL